MNRLSATLAGMWFGMQMMGYIIAPVLFDKLDTTTAGNIAGIMFQVIAYVGLLAWGLVYWVLRREHSKIFYRSSNRLARQASVALLLILALNQFLITPVIEAHKNHLEHWLLNLVGGSFALWHGISQSLYLLASLLGLALLLSLLRLEKN